MRKNVSHIFLGALLAFTVQASFAQPLSFRSISKDKGLSSLSSLYCTFDHRGFLWISTTDGLVRFNGHEVKYFYKQDYPELPTDQISALYCDSKNQIWVCTDKGLAVVNTYGQIERVEMDDTGEKSIIHYCMEGPDETMYAMSFSGSYAKGPKDTIWVPQLWLDTLFEGKRFRDVRRFDDDRFLVSIASKGVLLVNMKTKSLDVIFRVKGINTAYKFDNDHIIFGGGPGFHLFIGDIHHPDSIRSIEAPPFFADKNLRDEISYAIRAKDGNVYIATFGMGLVKLDSTLTHYQWYQHDPANPTTISTNSLRYLVTNETGNLVVASPKGIDYTNVNLHSGEYINYMKLDDGKLMDEPIFSIAEDRHHQIWVCTSSNVYIYNPLSRSAHPIIIPAALESQMSTLTPSCVAMDAAGQMWVGLVKEGILILDEGGKVIHWLRSSDFEKIVPGIKHVRIFRQGKDRFMYVGTEDGMFRFTLDRFQLDTFPDDPLLKPLKRERIVDILPGQNEFWTSTSPGGGLWHYSFESKKLDFFNDQNGLPTNRIYGLTENGDGNLYIGSYFGFSIHTPGDTFRNLLKGSGLVSSRVEALETANDGSIWLTNNFCLLKYDPVAQQMFRLNNRQGISHVIYSIMGSAKLSSGQLAFGTQQGFVLIDPDKTKFDETPLNTFVFFSTPDRKEMEIKPGDHLDFTYKQANVRFSFAVNDLMIADDVSYRYRLSSHQEGEWTSPSSNTIADFNLGSGKYTLEVECYDGMNWYAMPAPITFTIRPPWWKAWWFLALVGMTILSMIWFTFKGRIEKFKQELMVARHIAELESKALRAQMNPHFVFNSLNAIQECIVTGKIDEAYTYLSKFSRLLRMVLEHSDMSEVSLHAELEILNLYVSLEKLRFRDDMIIHFDINNELDTEEILMPPMLIQPHLENAVWHGLRDQVGEKLLTIVVNEKISGYLDILIEDNGIGRVKSAEIKSNRLGRQKHQSKGSKLSENRVQILKSRFPQTAMLIEDLYNEQGEAMGTRVHLTVPILKKNEMSPNSKAT